MRKVPEQWRQPMLASRANSVHRAMVAKVATLTTVVHRAQLTRKMAARGKGVVAAPELCFCRFTKTFSTKLVDKNGIHSREKSPSYGLHFHIGHPLAHPRCRIARDAYAARARQPS